MVLDLKSDLVTYDDVPTSSQCLTEGQSSCILTLFLSSFWILWSNTIRAYITTWSLGMFLIPSWSKNLTVLALSAGVGQHAMYSLQLSTEG